VPKCWRATYNLVTMDDQRSIRLGPRTWGTPPSREWPWTVSRAGSVMTRHHGRVAIIKEIRLTGIRSRTLAYKWALSPIDDAPGGKWVWSDETFDTIEAAKLGALIALGVRKKREPVPTSDDAQMETRMIDGRPERRIVVD